MGEKKTTPISIDGVEHILEEMTQEQQLMVNHISDTAARKSTTPVCTSVSVKVSSTSTLIDKLPKAANGACANAVMPNITFYCCVGAGVGSGLASRDCLSICTNAFFPTLSWSRLNWLDAILRSKSEMWFTINCCSCVISSKMCSTPSILMGVFLSFPMSFSYGFTAVVKSDLLLVVLRMR